MFIHPTKGDVYLGDSVYLQKNPNGFLGVALYTYNGMTVADEIILEPDVLINFTKELERRVAG
jgi:hypothetical protein